MTRDQQTTFLLSSALALVVGAAFGYVFGVWDAARMMGP